MFFTLALAGCAHGTERAAEPDGSAATTPGTPTPQRITPGAVVVLVGEHLGAGKVREHGDPLRRAGR